MTKNSSQFYTFSSVWYALQHDQHFDYVFYAEVLLILTSRIALRTCSKLLVPVATSIIIGLGYLGLFVISPALGWTMFWTNAIVAPSLIAQILRYYFLAVYTDAGYTHPNAIADDMCKKCQLPKPERAHHCSLCNRCTRRMDHHCPFINNCVGEDNYKYFVSFLLWTSLSTAYLAALSATLLLRSHPVGLYFRLIVRLEPGLDLFNPATENKTLPLLSFLPVHAINAWLSACFPSELFLFTVIFLCAAAVCLAVSLLLCFHAFLGTVLPLIDVVSL